MSLIASPFSSFLKSCDDRKGKDNYQDLWKNETLGKDCVDSRYEGIITVRLSLKKNRTLNGPNIWIIRALEDVSE